MSEPGTVAGREIVAYRLELITPFRGLTRRRGCLISGERGWGEFAPFEDYSPEADARWLRSALEQADGLWPAPRRDGVLVNAIIPAVDPERAAQMARDTSCRTIKVKIGDPDGVARVKAVRQARPDAALRVDVNGAWDVAEAVEHLSRMAGLGLEYAEQPVRGFEQMARLRELVDVPLAADELIRVDGLVSQVREVADVAVLKVPTLGGVAATVELAARVGLPVVISSALDSSLGLAAGLAAACALQQEPLACGLGTSALLADDTCAPLLPVAGRLEFAGYPVPRPDLPQAPEDLGYWRQRIAAAEVTGGHADG